MLRMTGLEWADLKVSMSVEPRRTIRASQRVNLSDL